MYITVKLIRPLDKHIKKKISIDLQKLNFNFGENVNVFLAICKNVLTQMQV